MRIPYHDPQSKAFPVRDLIGNVPRYKRIWTSGYPVFNQGHEGECTGYALGTLLECAPHKWTVPSQFGDSLYNSARKIDASEGRDFSVPGATLLATMKAGVSLGYFESYSWAFGIDDVIDAIVRVGPMLLGIPWLESMAKPSRDGLLTVSGNTVLGHCITANGYWPQHPDFGDVLVLTNTYGDDWGVYGKAYLRVEDAKELLSDCGEAVIPNHVLSRRNMVPVDDEGNEEKVPWRYKK